VYDAKYIKT